MSSKLANIARILVAAVLVAFVFILVPLRDSLHWPSRFGDEPLRGHLEWGESQVEFRSLDGAEVTLFGVAGSSWSRARLVGVEGGPPETFELSDSESQELEGQPVQGLWTTFQDLSSLALVLAFGCYLAAATTSFWRWRLLLDAAGVKTSLPRAIQLGFIGLFCSNVIPGMTGGDLVKAVYVARDHRDQKTEAVFSVLVDRVIGLLGLVIVAALAMLYLLQVLEARFPEVEARSQVLKLAWGVFLLLGAIVVGGGLVLSRKVRQALKGDRLLARLPAAGLLLKIDRAVLLYRDAPRAVATAVAVSLLVHGFVLTGIAILGQSLGLEVPFFLYYALAPIPLIVQAVPVAPAGFGVGEVAFVTVFATLAGLGTAQQALALALGYRLVQVSGSLVGGVLLWIRRDEKVDELPTEMAAIS